MLAMASLAMSLLQFCSLVYNASSPRTFSTFRQVWLVLFECGLVDKASHQQLHLSRPPLFTTAVAMPLAVCGHLKRKWLSPAHLETLQLAQ